LDELPRALRNEVLRDINMKVLRRAPIFFSCDKAMLGVLCGVLRRCVFLKGDVLSQQGGVANEMFILEVGRVLSTTKCEVGDDAEITNDAWAQRNSQGDNDAWGGEKRRDSLNFLRRMLCPVRRSLSRLAQPLEPIRFSSG